MNSEGFLFNPVAAELPCFHLFLAVSAGSAYCLDTVWNVCNLIRNLPQLAQISSHVPHHLF